MTEAHGTHDSHFTLVHDAFQRNIAAGDELGASLVVDVDGEVVVDLWGGFRDEARTTPWERDTITNVWSTTKTVVSLAALVLADRGELDLYAPVARYWPEFAENGKENVEVRHLLSHTSGVSGLEQPATVADLYDWDKVTARLAAQAPWWPPGTASGYHATNFGHLAGEVIRRVSGKTVKDFVAEELAGPLGADFRIGAAEADWSRIAPVVPPPPAQFAPAPGSVMAKTLTGPAVDAAVANTPAWRHADIGAVNGHGNARSVARMLSALALGGTVDGVRLLGPDTIDLVFAEQANGIDLGLGIPLRWGIGYALPRPDAVPWIRDGRVCFWGGWGGSVIIMDLDRRLTISYVMNKMAPGVIGSDRSTTYVDAVYAALD
jgi:CubicO group peptidase (beta-lactamase class C family)